MCAHLHGFRLSFVKVCGEEEISRWLNVVV